MLYCCWNTCGSAIVALKAAWTAIGASAETRKLTQGQRTLVAKGTVSSKEHAGIHGR